MKKTLFNAINVIAAIYSLGYIAFGYPNDTYVMHAITGIMTTIFSVNLLIFLFTRIENGLKKTN